MDQTTFDAVQAARDAAYWASWSAIAAWVIGLGSLAVTGAGLVFIWRQLRVAELNARAAVDAAHAALLVGRPWLAIRVIERASGRQLPDQPFTVTLKITVENIGHAPGLDLSLIALPVARKDWEQDAEAALTDDMLQGFLRGSLLPGGEIETTITVGWPDGAMPHDARMLIVCAYTIPGLPGRRITAKPYVVTVWKAGHVKDDAQVYGVGMLPATSLRLLMT